MVFREVFLKEVMFINKDLKDKLLPGEAGKSILGGGNNLGEGLEVRRHGMVQESFK